MKNKGNRYGCYGKKFKTKEDYLDNCEKLWVDVINGFKPGRCEK